MKATNTLRARRDNDLRDIILILAIGLGCYGLILLTDYVIWDGWWEANFIRNPSETQYLQRIFKEIGRPQEVFYFFPFFFTSNIAMLAKVIGVFGWIASCVFQYRYLRKAICLPREAALAIALVSLACPFFTFWGELTYNMYVISVMFFWFAWALTASRIENYRIRVRMSLLFRILIVLFFILSFELNSNLAHLYAVGALTLIATFKMPPLKDVRSSLLVFSSRYWEIALLPIVYWIWKITCTPTSGYYSNYNKVEIGVAKILEGYAIFFKHLPDYFARITWESLGFSLLFAFLLAILVSVYKTPTQRLTKIIVNGNHTLLLLGGIFLLLASPFSYIVVGQPVICAGWEARNTILLNFPFAIIAVTLCALVIKKVLPLQPQWLIVAVGYIISVGMLTTNYTTLRWQAFGAKQVAIQKGIRQILHSDNAKAATTSEYQNAPTTEKVNVINLRDYYQIPNTLHWYPHVIWTYVIAPPDSPPQVFVMESTGIIPDKISIDSDGRESRTVQLLSISETDLFHLKESTTLSYALSQIPSVGRTKNIAILPGSLGNNGVRIGMTYLAKKLFDIDSLDAYTDSIITIKELN